MKTFWLFVLLSGSLLLSTASYSVEVGEPSTAEATAHV